MRRFFEGNIAFAWTVASILGLTFIALATPAAAGEVLPPISERFADDEITETPNFQKHVVPLLGRLGCNGRACHGSFQGQGGFRLSLFGYDFKADYVALTDEESPRLDKENPLESLMIAKPTSEDMHEGGKRYDVDSWSYNVIHQWIKDGAQFEPELVKLENLRIEPSEIQFTKAGDATPLRVIAVWENGVEEDVTPLCRYKSNDSEVAKVDLDGRVTSGAAGDTHVVVSYDKAVVAVPVIRPVTDKVGDRYPQVVTKTAVDSLVVAKLKKLGVVPSEVCTDEEFLRRVSLDLTGTLPSANEVREFLADSSKGKRQAKIDKLLDSPAYVAWWTTKLCDFTGNNTEQTINLAHSRDGASKHWYEWIYSRVEENAPYDNLISGIVLGSSRQEAETYTEFCEAMTDIHAGVDGATFADRSTMPYYWARRDFRQPPERAISFAHAFLGVKIQCAQCHKHPFDQWSKDDFDEFSKFFSGVTSSNSGAPASRKEYSAILAGIETADLKGGQLRRKFTELLKDGKLVPFPEVYISHNPKGAKNARKRPNKKNAEAPQVAGFARMLGGQNYDLAQITDPREPLMNWLRAEDNPYFAKAFVNRVWAAHFGSGIVNPPDDLSIGNPPSNRALLEYLATGFIGSKFDMKWVHREILNSESYQRSWRPNDTNLQDRKNFSRAIPRRLPAEIVHDAILQATGSDEFAAKWRTEMDDRAIAIAGGGSRDNSSVYALGVFGRNTRESSCDCDRSDMPNLLQTIYMQNDQDVLKMIDRRGDGWLRQVATALGAKESEIPPNVTAQLVRLDRSIKQLEKRGNKEALKKSQDRRQALFAKYGDPNEKPKIDDESDADFAKIIDDAYLRTVSRYPKQEEKERALAYIAEGDDKVESFRGLVWALINTKEFIVNH